jgi:hypothetical protein
VVSVVAVLPDRSGSGAALPTVALLVITPRAFGVTVIVTVALAPGASVPSAQSTRPAQVCAARGCAHERHVSWKQVDQDRVRRGVGAVVGDLQGVDERGARRDRGGRVRPHEREVAG